MTTRRHSAADIERMQSTGTVGAFSLRASDRYGDHGLVGVAIVRLEDRVAAIDSFLLSCRVIGRGVESALMAHIAEWARGAGVSVLEGEFIPTAKNAPSATLFESHGFVMEESDASGTRWTLDLERALPKWPEHIARDGTTGESIEQSMTHTAAR